MANRERQVRIYDLHSWTGVALGLLLFLVAFTGCVALFFGEFQPWEDPAQRIQRHGEAIPLHGMLADVASDVGSKGELAYLSVTPGGHGHAHAEVYASWRDADGEIHQEHMHINPNTGEIMPERGSGASRFLYDLHRDLAWPDALGGRQVGRFIVGVVGIAFMLTIVTGIVAHTKITKELFTLRYLRSVRLKWQDTHKVFGLWTVPFSAMIALTGAWLGVIALVTPLFAAIVAKGDVEALYKEFGLAAGEPSGIAADMLSVDQFTPSVHPKTGEPLVFISVDNWGDESAVYHLYYGVSDQLKYYDELKVSAVSGEPIVDRSSQLAERPAFRISAAFSPLHYGTFGGIFLKVIYFLLGLALAVMAALGNMMWIERRLHGNEGSRTDAFYRKLSAINTGVCVGLPLASVAAIGFDKLYFGAEQARYSTVASVFFFVWFVAGAFAYWRRADYRSTKELLFALAACLFSLPILNTAMTGDFIVTSFGTGAAASAWFDIAFLMLAGCVVAAGIRLPAERPVKKKAARKDAEPVVAEPIAVPAE